MGDGDDRSGLELQRREVAALEHLARELSAIQDTLELIAQHVTGGLSAEEVRAAVLEARELKQRLRTKREQLAASIEAAAQLKETPRG